MKKQWYVKLFENYAERYDQEALHRGPKVNVILSNGSSITTNLGGSLTSAAVQAGTPLNWLSGAIQSPALIFPKPS